MQHQQSKNLQSAGGRLKEDTLVEAIPASQSVSATVAGASDKRASDWPWICVSERLPEAGIQVLFYMPAYRCQLLGTFHPASEFVPMDHFTLASFEMWPLAKVSHWAYLPQDPQT